MITEQIWLDAQDELLQDVDTFTDWLYGECMNRKADAAYVNRMAGRAEIHGFGELRGMDVASLVYLERIETSPQSLLLVRSVINGRYLGEHQSNVHEIALRMAAELAAEDADARNDAARDDALLRAA